jgi:branched-chain amino acid transport system permease protein
MQRLLIVAVALVMIAAVYAFVRWSPLGKALRAVSQDIEAASLMGINVNMIVAVTFLIGFGLAGLAGVLLGPILLVSPFMAERANLKAFAIIVMGGFGNVEGAIIAGLVLGLVESLASGFLIGAWSESIAFVMLIAVLLVRPTGLVQERMAANV